VVGSAHHPPLDYGFFYLELNSRDLLCYSRRMNETQLLQGRLISPENIEQIRALMIENPTWHRTRLSIEILWQGGAGKLPLRLIVIAPIPYRAVLSQHCLLSASSLFSLQTQAMGQLPSIHKRKTCHFPARQEKLRTADRHGGATYTAKAAHAHERTAIMSFKVIRATALNYQFKWWAVPTLRAREWLRYGACAHEVQS
jgi:hypothetical protein